MYRIAICDDDKNFITYIEEMIAQCEINQKEIEFYEFESGEELIRKMGEMISCELLILDMQLKKLDGHATAKYFREVFPDAILVFCSGVSHPTDESFKATPYRYLQKSYSEEKMLCELQAILDKMRGTKPIPTIVGKNHYNIVKLKPSDILYIENFRRGSVLHIREETKDYSFEDKITTKFKLAELYEILSEYDFEYAHNSYLVNLNYVIKMTSEGVMKLVNGKELNVSRSKLPQFRQSLIRLLGDKYF